jgi:hypothetical protein
MAGRDVSYNDHMNERIRKALRREEQEAMLSKPASAEAIMDLMKRDESDEDSESSSLAPPDICI